MSTPVNVDLVYDSFDDLKAQNPEEREEALMDYIGALLNTADRRQGSPMLLNNRNYTKADLRVMCDTAKFFWLTGALDLSKSSDKKTFDSVLRAEPAYRQARLQAIKEALGKVASERIYRSLRPFMNQDIWACVTGRSFGFDWANVSGAPLGFDAGATLSVGPESNQVGVTFGVSIPRPRNAYVPRSRSYDN